MSTDNTYIWSLAEAYVSETISDADRNDLLQRLQSDTEFATVFNESVNTLRALSGSAKQKHFRAVLRQAAAEYKAGQTTTKLIPLRPNYFKVAAMAAGIAVCTSFATYWAMNGHNKKGYTEYTTLSNKVENLERSTGRIISDINTIKDKNNTPPAQARYTGTGFAISNDGYLVTNYHVVEGNDSIYIQDHDGKYFKASIKVFDITNDIAVLKVESKHFRFGKTDVPYTFATEKSGLAARIYTLGFPKEELVYSEGYISGKNGYNANPGQYRLELPTEPGQSGSPVLDEKGNVLAIVTAHGNEDEGNTYAVSSSALLKLIKDSLPDVRLPKSNKLRHLTREQQIQKLESYTCSVKVYKK